MKLKELVFKKLSQIQTGEESRLSLSNDLTKAASLLLGGCLTREVQPLFDYWKSRKSHLSRVTQRWIDLISDLLEQSISEGGSIGLILLELSRYVHCDEKGVKRLQGVEKQFALQGAIVLLIPWFIVALQSQVQWSLFYLIALILQGAGALSFIYILSRLKALQSGALSWLKAVSLRSWVHMKCGASLLVALQKSINASSGEAILEKKSQLFWKQWEQWIEYRKGGVFDADPFKGKYSRDSRSMSEVLDQLLIRGAPADHFFQSYIEVIESKRQSEWEEQMNLLPTYLSLILVCFFAPAVFLILFGSLFSQIQGLL